MKNIKNILKDKFNLAAIASFGVLLVLIFAFIVLSLVSNPHIRFFEVNGTPDSANLINQRVKVYFSSPMNKENAENHIQIEPLSNFKTAWSNNTLFIIFDSNLNADTTYKIKFGSDFKDLYNKTLSTSEISFKTSKLEFMFVKTSNTTKSLVKSDLNFNLEEIYSDKNIQTFDAKSNFAVVVSTSEDKTNIIKIVNVKSKEVTTLDIRGNLIPSIAVSPVRNEFAFVRQSAIVRSTYAQALEDTSIVVYNLDTKEQKSIDFNNPGEGVTNIKYSPDGNSILYKTSQSYYQLLDISNPDNNIGMGRFLSDGGFNFDGSKLAFVEFDPVNAWTSNQYIVELNSERKSKLLTDGTIPVLDPEYLNNSDSLLYAIKYQEQEGTKGRYRIVEDSKNGEVKVVVEDETRSLELPKISFDDKYILLEGYKETDLLDFNNSRSFGFQTKPQTSDVLMFDIAQNKLIDPSIRGYDIVWLQ